MVRRVILVSVLLAALGAVSAFAFDPDELNKVTFQNSTGTKIEMIFLSPGDSDYWGPDLIGADYILKDGASIGYYVHYPESTFKFDILAIDDKGNKFELYDFDITDGKEETIRLTRKNLNGDAPDFDLATVSVSNDTGMEIDYLFLSPEDSDAWGADLLDEETVLEDGDVHSVVIPVGDEAVTYYLMAADENNDEYIFDITIDPGQDMEYDVAIEPSDMQ